MNVRLNVFHKNYFHKYHGFIINYTKWTLFYYFSSNSISLINCRMRVRWIWIVSCTSVFNFRFHILNCFSYENKRNFFYRNVILAKFNNSSGIRELFIKRNLRRRWSNVFILLIIFMDLVMQLLQLLPLKKHKFSCSSNHNAIQSKWQKPHHFWTEVYLKFCLLQFGSLIYPGFCN